MKKILVTGGLGFIGTVLMEYLLRRDDIDYIDVVDNLCNSSMSTAYVDGRVYYHRQSVSEFEATRSYTEIYHLASPVGPAGVLNYAGRMGPMIVDDVNKMAQLAIKNNARLLDISTSEVYGREPNDKAQSEDIDKVVPANITIRLEYGVAKLLSEVFLTNLTKSTDLEVNLVRPFNIVGVGQKGEVGFVLPRFVEAALAGTPLTVFGNGSQQRTFTSVKDFVEGILLIQNSDVSGEIYNIGNAKNICSVLDLAKLVLELTGSPSDIELVDPKTIYGPHYAEAWNKIPNSSKVMKAFGWQPTRDLQGIVTEVIESYGL